MKGKNVKRELGKRISALLLALVMTASVITVPVKAAENETAIALIDSVITEEAMTVEDAYEEGSYIATHRFDVTDEVKAAASAGNLLSLEVNVTVNSHEFATGTPEVLIYAMDGAWGNWQQAAEAIVEGEDTYNLSLDLSGYTSISELALRFKTGDDGAKVNYTINSAKVTGVFDETGETGGDEFGDASEGDVIATIIDTADAIEGTTVDNEYGNDFIVDHIFTVPQEVKAAATAGVPMNMNVSVTVNSHDLVTGTPEIVIYAMDGLGANWNQVQKSVKTEPDTYELTLDLSSYTSVGTLGLRFATYDEGAVINYTINSAEVVVGKKQVVDEDAVVTLIGSETEGEGTVVKNPYGIDYIVDYPFAITDDLKNAIAGDEPLTLEVSVTVNEYTCSSKTVPPTIVLYAMDEEMTGSSWKQASTNITESGKTYEVSLNLASYTSIGQLGMRFVGCDVGTVIQYTIHSAKIVVGKEIVEDPNADAILAEPGTEKSGVVIKNAYGEDFIVDNPFVIPHDLTFGLQGYTSLSLEVGVTVNAYTPGNVDKTEVIDGVPRGAKVVIYAQDAKYSMWEQEYVMLTETPQTENLVLDLAPFIEDGTLGGLGLRFNDVEEGTIVDYTIEYAKIVGEGESLANAGVIDLKYELTGEKKEIAFEDTEVGKHGKLSVKPISGYTTPIIVDENGEPYQLRGGSSHGLSWFPGYINKDAYQTFRDEWGMNMIRIAVYAREGAYAYVNGEEAEAYNDELIQAGVQAATELGMYAIIDWHVLNYNPNGDYEDATAFFEKYATMYKDYDNIIFEICNEPTRTEWYDGSDQDLYTYCTKVTKTIRDCGSEAIVICGTNSYSSEVDKVAVKPLEDQNVLYACHFYAASHYDEAQKKFTDALAAGVPVIISEFGVCTATGDGMYDVENADKWLDICDANNVSYACWAMSNSEESAAYFQSDCWKYDGAWTEDQLTTTSKYIINRYRGRQEELDKQAACGHTSTELRNVKTANCKEEGYTGDTYCKDCNKKMKIGTTIAKVTTHSWDVGKVTTPATEKADGTKTYTCTVCGNVKNETIPATGTTNTQPSTEVTISVKGTVLEDNATGAKYKVLTADSKTGTVEYAAPIDAKVKNVTIPATVTINGIRYNVTSIAKSAFVNNKKLTKVVIGSNVTSIGANAFKGCINLKALTIGKNVKKIGKKAFYGCKNLKKITIKTSKLTSKNVGSKAFSKTHKKAVVKVPKKNLKAYKKLLVKKGINKKAVIKK